jgi:Flp pilus assembly pilin Flp
MSRSNLLSIVEYTLFLLAVSVVIVGYFAWFFWMLGTSGRG